MDEAQAWSGYWAQVGAVGGCVPGAVQVGERLGEIWKQFARKLPENERLLDLATGAGAVARALCAANSSVQVTGVDFAVLPASGDSRIVYLSGTPLTALPFADGSFGAVTSQFGFEYDAGDASIAEIARVGRADAAYCFVVHHRESPIATQNRERLAALRAIAASGVLKAARRDLGRHRSAAVEKHMAATGAAYPRQTVVGEITEALRYALDLGASEGARDLTRIEAGIERETILLAGLERAVHDDSDIVALAARLGAAGIACEPPRTIAMSGGSNPIGWLVSARRAG